MGQGWKANEVVDVVKVMNTDGACFSGADLSEDVTVIADNAPVRGQRFFAKTCFGRKKSLGKGVPVIEVALP